VFVTSFSPLCMIITAALGFIILAEQTRLGRYIYIYNIMLFINSFENLHIHRNVLCADHFLYIYIYIYIYFSIIGATLIVFGLYTVVWGKSKDLPISKATGIDEKSGTQELPITDTTKSINASCKNDVVAAGILLKNPATV
jgi:hypothetical protein